MKPKIQDKCSAFEALVDRYPSGLHKKIKMGRFRPSDIVVFLNRSELSLEHFFEQNTVLLEYNTNSLCLYISGCPAMHLFELFIINITEKDYFNMKKQI